VRPDTKNSGPAAIGSTLPGSGVIFAGYTLFLPAAILFPLNFSTCSGGKYGGLGLVATRVKIF
jgi:hypothetical protein